MEFTLLWAALTAAVFIWVGVRIWHEGVPPKSFDILIGSAAAGLLVGRLAAMASQGINPFTDPLQVLIVRGGVSTGFAAVGALAAILWVTKGRLSHIDALAPAAVLGLAGWHAGCVWRSACLGTASELPWAWAQEGSAITRHPVEIYAALALMVTAYGVGRLPRRTLLRSGLALAAAGGVRLATEPMRHTLTGGPIAWYATAIVVGIVIAGLWPLVVDRANSPQT